MDKKNQSGEQDGSFAQSSSKESAWMVYLSTFVAVCGSFAFGSCVSLPPFI
jgi:SP family facilitated glucose transporter-like MFS transporter 8